MYAGHPYGFPARLLDRLATERRDSIVGASEIVPLLLRNNEKHAYHMRMQKRFICRDLVVISAP